MLEDLEIVGRIDTFTENKPLRRVDRQIAVIRIAMASNRILSIRLIVIGCRYVGLDITGELNKFFCDKTLTVFPLAIVW